MLASQAKIVDQVVVIVPVWSLSQANEAQFYVSMLGISTSIRIGITGPPCLKMSFVSDLKSYGEAGAALVVRPPVIARYGVPFKAQFGLG